MTINTPGVYDLPVDEYHAMRHMLSSSGARLLLEAPAKFKARIDNPPTPTATFDFGHAAHRLVLGAGADIQVVYAQSWRSAAARDERDLAHINGLIPLLTSDYDTAKAMAARIEAHPVAGKLFTGGAPEQTLVWQDEETGVWCRALVDYLPHVVSCPFEVVDYKTARSADPEAFAKSAASYGYAQQAAWYLDGVKALGLDDEPRFLFVVQEKTPPYLISVIELDVTAMRIGRSLNQRALQLYAECLERDDWPGYSEEVQQINLPFWWEARNEEIEV